MLLAHAVAGTPQAVTFVASENPQSASDIAIAILNSKLNTYNAFNLAYPGYGGFLPPFQSNDTAIWPTDAWFAKVPAADNGCVRRIIGGIILMLLQTVNLGCI